MAQAIYRDSISPLYHFLKKIFDPMGSDKLKNMPNDNSKTRTFSKDK
jgi:hypothetical protein